MNTDSVTEVWLKKAGFTVKYNYKFEKLVRRTCFLVFVQIFRQNQKKIGPRKGSKHLVFEIRFGF